MNKFSIITKNVQEKLREWRFFSIHACVKQNRDRCGPCFNEYSFDW